MKKTVYLLLSTFLALPFIFLCFSFEVEPVLYRNECIYYGNCSDYYGRTICPGTEEFPAGLCTKCEETYTILTCSGEVAQKCEQTNGDDGCGTMSGGVCNQTTGNCENYAPSTTSCGMVKTCRDM